MKNSKELTKQSYILHRFLLNGFMHFFFFFDIFEMNMKQLQGHLRILLNNWCICGVRAAKVKPFIKWVIDLVR